MGCGGSTEAGGAKPTGGDAKPTPATPTKPAAKAAAPTPTGTKSEDRPFITYKDVKDTMAEYLTKPPYEVEVGINKVKVKLHHNPKGAKEHANIMSKVLTKELYEEMSSRVTPNGVTFDKCIQTGVQNP